MERASCGDGSPGTPRRRRTSPQPTELDPDTSADWLHLDDLPAPNVAEAIEELRRLIDAFEDVRPDEMTTMLYIRAFNELTMSGRQLLEVLGDDSRS